MLGAGLLALAACAPEKATEDEEIVIGSAFYSLTSGSVAWLNGTYTGCSSRTGSWSVRVSGNGAMDNPALSVVKGDTACALRITSVMADQNYAASPALLLSTSYAASASTFGSGGSAFLANAKLDDAAFAADFQLSFLYADTSPPVATSSNVDAAYATVAATATASSIALPNYTLNVSTLHFTADGVRLVFAPSGYATLFDGTVTGAAYVIDGTLGASPTFAQVESAYNAMVVTSKAISGANPQIQASEFNVVTLSLYGSTTIRNVIVKRSQGSINAYQVFRVTFNS